MLDKISMSFYAAYLKFKLKLMELEEEEDGMETLETVILIAIAVVVGLFILNLLTKNFNGSDKGLIGYIFDKIKDKIDEIFN